MRVVNNINYLITELETQTTLDRILKYGPLNTLYVFIDRNVDISFNNHFKPFLTNLDDFVLYIKNNSNYPLNLDQKLLGEIYNLSKLKRSDSTPESFFNLYFSILNYFLFTVSKITIYHIYNDNSNVLNNIDSLSRFLKLNIKNEYLFRLKKLIIEYEKKILTKPTSYKNPVSELTRFKFDYSFSKSIIDNLEAGILNEIKFRLSNPNFKDTNPYKLIK